MAVSDDVFKLIKSLSKSEKGYFKKYAYKNSGREKKSSDNHYIKLFDIIDKQENYDEGKTLKKLGKSPLVKSFSSSKNYLLSLVLGSLLDYNANKDNALQIAQNLAKARILYSRGLQSQSTAHLKKAEQVAIANEYTAAFPIISYAAMTMMPRMISIEKRTDWSIETGGNYRFAGEKVAADGTYNVLYHRVLALIKEDETVRSQAHRDGLLAMCDDPLLAEDVELPTFYSKHIHLVAKHHLYDALGRSGKVEQLAAKLIDLWKSSEFQQQENPMMFLGCLANIFTADIVSNEGRLFNENKVLLSLPSESFTNLEKNLL